MTLDELKALERKLYAEVESMQTPFESKRSEWHSVYKRIEAAEAKEKLRAELLAEMEAEKSK